MPSSSRRCRAAAVGAAHRRRRGAACHGRAATARAGPARRGGRARPEARRRAERPRPGRAGAGRPGGRSRRKRAPRDAADAVTRVAVLKGGRSLERQVSLKSGARVQDALERLGHETLAIDVGHGLIERAPGGGAGGRVRRPPRPRRGGRDGAGAARDPRHPAYGVGRVGLHPLRRQGPGQARDARRRAADARLLRVQRDGVQGARGGGGAAGDRASPGLPAGRQAGRPGVGARGQARRARRPHVPAALVAAFSYDRKVLLERFVDGREFAVSILQSADGRAARGAAGARGGPGGRRTTTSSRRATRSAGRRFVCPAELPAVAASEAQELALAVYELIGCYGLARVDLMRDAASGAFEVLEVNVDPGPDRDEPPAAGRRRGGDRLRRADRPHPGVGGGPAVRAPNRPTSTAAESLSR